MSQGAVTDDVDVVVVGAGPVGALAAILLGQYGVRTVLIEKDRGAHGQPRAFSCDDEARRILQSAGLDEAMRREMFECHRLEYVGAGGKPFAEVCFDEVDFGFGYRPLQFYHQPSVERLLRERIASLVNVRFDLGVELVSLTQDAGGVTLGVKTDAGARTLRCRYLLGCDGTRSTVRDLLGVALQGDRYPESWLGVSVQVPAEAVRQKGTRFICDWRRPGFVAEGVRGEYRLEFLLLPSETKQTMEAPDRIRALLEPYVDPSRATLNRATVYQFHNVEASAWRRGRVFLCGDAAHQIPPFLGQGLCSGFRDVANVAWKVATALRGPAAEGLLDSYEAERRPHTRQMAQMTVATGKVFLVRSAWLAGLRDAFFRLIQRLARVRRFVRHFEFKPPPLVSDGWLGPRRPGVGAYFPQPTLRIGQRDGLLDSVLGGGFAVVAYEQDPRAAVANVPPPALGRALVRVLRAPSAPLDGVVDVVDLNGVLGAWFRRHRAACALLRPDRFVACVADDPEALARACVPLLRSA